MKLKYKKMITLCCLIFIILILSISIIDLHKGIKEKSEAQHYLNYNIKSSQSWILNPFIISQTGGGNGTWVWANNQSWCSGSGTESDPYIIENITIDCGCIIGISGITIIDSNVSFIIQNSTIVNCGSASDDAGIKLLNTDNGILRKNDLSYNLGNGIYFNNSNNNAIIENEIRNNQYYGIYFCSYCDNNILTENTLYLNGLAGSSYHGIFLDNYCEYNNINVNYVRKSGGDGIRIEYFSHNNTIVKNEVLNNYYAGITITLTSSDCTVNENKIINNSYYGILVSSASDRTSIKYNLLKENALFALYPALYAVGSDFLNITGNIFDYNYFGIFLRYAFNCDVINNKLIDTVRTAIYIEFFSEDNKILNNYILNSENGIIVYDRNINNVIMDNIIIQSSARAIQVDHQSNTNTISSNYLLNNYYGIEVRDNSDNNNITKNIIKTSFIHGLRIASGCENTLIFQNYFIYNTLQVENYESTTQYNYTAFGNYWSNYTGYDLDDDGIGDIPHPIISFASGIDYYPIFKDIPNIFIDEYTEYNWAWAAQQYWVNGTGTEEDPYIIQNMIIDEDWQAPSIEIRNSEQFFVISNCTLTTKEAPFPGIIFYNVENGKIEDTTISNSQTGIELDGSSEIKIVSNQINYNGIGIQLSGSEQVNVSNNNLDHNSIGLYIYKSNYNIFRENSLLNTDMCILEYDSVNNVFENNICDPEPLKTLYMIFIEQIFTMDEFSITFFIYNENYEGIIAASISLYWNGTDASLNVTELGNGNYIVSLHPFFVEPGEPGIPFEATISKADYETLVYSCEIAVDPDTVQKEGKPSTTPRGISWSAITLLMFSLIGIVSLVAYYSKKRNN